MSEKNEEVVEELENQEVESAESSPEESTQEVMEATLAEMRGDDSASDSDEDGKKASDTDSIEEEEFDPSNLSDRAQARFRELSERAKNAEESAAQIQQQGEELYRIMNDSGATAQDLTAFFEFQRALRGSNQDAAKKYFDELSTQYSRFTGKPVGDVDVLNQYPDLKKQVDDYEITEENARELANLRDYSSRMRDMEVQQAEFNAQYSAQQEQQQQAASYAERASVDIDSWSKQMQSKDPDFEAKESLILQRAQEVFPQLHPAHWPEFVAKEYEYISAAFPKKEPKPRPNLIRPGTSGGSPRPEAKSVGDAMAQALEEMRS